MSSASSPPTDTPGSASSSSPRFHRALSLDAYLQSEGELPNLHDDDSQDENDLTEEQLREMYDTEEIERFLDLFSVHVTEVRLPESPKHPPGPEVEPSRFQSEDGEWTPVHPDDEEFFPPVEAMPPPRMYKSLSEEIACDYFLPILPHSRPPAPPFTIGRLRLTCQRLYLAVLPIYGPFLSQMWELATWEDSGTSLIYCTIYWTLWWYNMLAPAFVLRLLFALVQRKVFPYPSLEDLRRHREETLRADEFGEQVSERLSAASSSMMEMWRLLKLYDLTKHKVKSTVKGKAKEKTSIGTPGQVDIDPVPPSQDATVLDDAEDDDVAKDFKRTALQLLVEIADVHERIRNVFIWRRPSSSQKYGIALFITFLTTLLPAIYISKVVFFGLGFLFWHVVPLFAALPPSDKSRIPPPLHDVPTDAEYAMELISQRVAAGLPVKPAKTSKHDKKNRSTDSLTSPPLSSKSPKHKTTLSEGRQRSVDWKKFGDCVALGKSAVQDIKRLKPGKPWPTQEAWPPRHPIIPGAIGIGQQHMNMETHTYPCQHSSAPGLITLTHRTLYFTPLMSQSAKIITPLSAVKGVKKVGLLKGLHIRWTDSSDGNQEQKEEKFMWVGSRDDLFARLVGTEGRRWVHV